MVVMDCDLQHPPETVVEMYRLWEDGYEVVEGVKRSRGREGAAHKASAGMFYKIMSKATKIDMSRASDFKLLDRRAVAVLLGMPERNAFFRALSSWIGFQTATVEFDVREREAGESKWSTWSLVKYAVTNIAAFSSVPLQIVTVAGAFMFVSRNNSGDRIPGEILWRSGDGRLYHGHTAAAHYRESCDDESGDYRLLYC